jgi:ssDNA thymidine ADP-ribosyltransferase, DarT
MPECLVHLKVPWDAITEVVTKTRTCAEHVSMILATVDQKVPVFVRPHWYF